MILRYNYYTSVEESVHGGEETFAAPLGKIPIHVRGGNVIPTQNPASNTVASRKNPFGLIIALDDSDKASGELYWDEGDSLEPIVTGQYALFQFYVQNARQVLAVSRQNKLTTTAEGSQSIASGMTMGSLTILGVTSAPGSVRVNGNNVNFAYSNGVSGGNDVMEA
ncbi:unnamed protein product [Clavelina lepadiformis]|uniref:Uncharacterized protein n=1 Tax=Clavelina lepadiformis TaxID=159417 RepID=A0ABP0G8E9_CLALP